MPTPRPDFEHFIAANEYGFYCVPTAFRKRKVPEMLRAGEVYEPITLQFLRRHIGTGDIVTGGVFVGDFLPALAEVLAPKAQIHTFEPNPVTFQAAQYTIAINKLKSINLHEVAVGEKDETLKLQTMREGRPGALAASAKITDRDLAGHKTIDVAVKTLDSLVPKSRKVSLLHLDVEGFELPALKGATRIITNCAPILVLETGGRKQRRQYREYLAEAFPDAGYVLTSQIEENGIYIPLGHR